MELLSQSMKGEMEVCKRRAREAGLVFQDNTLEYVVTNQDMLELSPRVMIPTLYDYWAFDVEVHRNRWMYDIHPHNPYETVINTRPPISFYNQDNADWFNVMIFYHVLGHIDFFQNNTFFRRTWDDDFCGEALADKRLIDRIRRERGDQKRWVDYLIEFARAIDNLVGFHQELKEGDETEQPEIFGAFSEKADFYFGRFLKELFEANRVKLEFYYDEIERYNNCVRKFGKKQGEIAFFEDNTFRSKLPEFNDVFKKRKEKGEKPKPKDIFEHLAEHSDFLGREENGWMKEVLQVIRKTSLYFQPQMRTKIANEGWASFWHQTLFMADDRMSTHEVDFARVDSGVTFNPRLGINPYAAGKHLFEFIEALAQKGRLSPEYQLLKGIDARKKYDRDCGQAMGRKALFEARRYLDDYLLVNFLSDSDFQDFMDEHRLFIAGVRPSKEKWDRAEIYIKSRSGVEYRRLLNRMLYHPPQIDFSGAKAKSGELYLDHVYEGRSLYRKYIGPVLIGLEFLWGHPVKLETTEYEEIQPKNWWDLWRNPNYQPKYKKIRVLYTCEKRKATRVVISQTTTDSYEG